MTKLTADQMVEQLRSSAHYYCGATSAGKPMADQLLSAADLIEAQAEKLDAFRAAIQSENHDVDCSSWGSADFEPRKCDCAKSLL